MNTRSIDNGNDIDEGDRYIVKLIKGLQNNNVTYDDFKSGRWSTYGSNFKIEDFKKGLPNLDIPPEVDSCICGHHIKENCYVSDGQKILILGNCCIKKFLPGGISKRCELCKRSHKNRKNNLCNDCRNLRDCPICSVKYSYKDGPTCDNCKHYILCIKCNKWNLKYIDNVCKICVDTNQCAKCLNRCKYPYTKCWKCFNSNTLSVCIKCGCNISGKYGTCYKCTYSHNCKSCDRGIAQKYDLCYMCSKFNKRT